MSEPTRTERRLRRAVVGLGMACAALVLVIGAIVAVTFLYFLGPEGDPFTRGPHLVRVGTDSATLRWRLADAGDRVDLRAVGPDGDEVAAREGTLHGLRPGTAYAWTAAIDGTVRAAGTVRTAPLDLSPPVRMAVFGDTGPGNDAEWAVGRLAAAQSPDLALVPGDIVSPIAVPPLFDRNLFRPLAELAADTPLYGTVGDHDIAWRGGRDVARALELPGDGDRFAIDHGPVRIVAIGLEGDRGDVAFLRRELGRPGADRRFVMVHRPVKPGNPVVPALRGADAVLAGHLHRYERGRVGGVLQIVAGTGGAARSDRFTPETAGVDVSLTEYGVLRVDVGERRVRYTFIDLAGRVRDRHVAP